MTENYQKKYRESYKKNNKIVTFPLTNIFYEQLRKKSIYYDLSINSYAKNIVCNFLNADTTALLTKDRLDIMNEYIRVSRGIANNINQIAYKSNIGEYVDINVLINSLKHYEDEFKKFVKQ